MKLVVNIEKRLRSFTLAANFTLTDTTLALLGASGSGKSMTLKCIAGLERPDRGQILLNGRTLYDSEKGINLPPQARGVGYLFQNYARLSGGQQQRAAFARILARGADLLLLDEPLSALDTHLKWQIETALREILSAQNLAAILVTHDRDEAFRIAQEIAVVDRGRLTPPIDKHELFRRPGTRAATILTGCKNISAARRADAEHVEATDWGITLRTAESTSDVQHIAIRAHSLMPAQTDGENVFPARVTEVIESTFTYIVMLRFADGAVPIRWETDKAVWRSLHAAEGAVLHFRFPAEELMLLAD